MKTSFQCCIPLRAVTAACVVGLDGFCCLPVRADALAQGQPPDGRPATAPLTRTHHLAGSEPVMSPASLLQTKDHVAAMSIASDHREVAAGSAGPNHAPAARHWLAFFAESAGNPPHSLYIFNQTPEIILFQDGHIIWRDNNYLLLVPGESPHLWREGQVNQTKLLVFIRMAKHSTFYVATPTPEVPKIPVGPDEFSDHIGLNIARRSRIVRLRSLAIQQQNRRASRFVKSAAALVAALRALEPRPAHDFQPGTIVVYASYPEGATRREWPLPGPVPLQTTGSIYSGNQAKALIRALSKTVNLPASHGTIECIWRPAIDLPSEGQVNLNPSIPD